MLEFRIKDINVTLEGENSIGGYINVTERESEMLYSKNRGKWFKEVVKKGAFSKALAENRSIPLLFEHDFGKELANTSTGTLELREDNIGLRFDAVITDEKVYNDIKNGKINSCSFGFHAKDQEFIDVNTRLEKRYLKEIELVECSLVRNPAYVGSLVESRALEEALKSDEEELRKKSETETEEVAPEETEVVPEESTPEETHSESDKEEEKEVEEEATKKEEEQEETKEETSEVEEEEKEDRDATSVEDSIVTMCQENAKDIVKDVVEGVVEEKKQQSDFIDSEIEYINERKNELATQKLRLELEILKLSSVKDYL